MIENIALNLITVFIVQSLVEIERSQEWPIKVSLF